MKTTSMDREAILNTLKEIFPTLQEKFGVFRIGVFGSVARNQAQTDSDIDVFVEMKPDLFKRVSLKAELESILGKKVDVIRYWAGMNKFLKNRIDCEGVYVRYNFKR